MGNGHRLMGWLLVAAQALAGWLAWRHYRALPEPNGTVASGLGHVSIVIPARNEAHRLPDLLRSLQHLRYPDRDVLVVDDGSSDGTPDVARQAGARVLSLAGPEGGWTGKSFGCWRGAESTQGEWILFTDADTVHGPDSLGVALDVAVAREAGLVSLLAQQRCHTFWERLLLPYAYALYFVGARRVNQTGGSAMANGQYLLFRREDYDQIGGHAAVRESLIEDVALARVAARAGVQVVLVRGERYLQVRMYSDLYSLWEGFGKSAVRFVSVSPRTGLPTVLAGMAYGAALPVAVRCRSPLPRLALLLTPAVCFLPWERRFGVPLSYAFFYPLAAAVFQSIALDSIRRSVLPYGTVWKGRRY